MFVRLIVRGLLAGVLMTGALAIWEGVRGRGYLFGLLTGLIGVPAGGIMLVLAFAMALTSYYMARAGRFASLRQRLLAGAIFTGAAGMTCGFTSAALWLAAGRPWFP